MSQSIEVPISSAEQIGVAFEKTQVIIVTFDNNGTTTVTTWGLSLKDSQQAAMGGNFVKKACGFPDEKCHDVPERTV